MSAKVFIVHFGSSTFEKIEQTLKKQNWEVETEAKDGDLAYKRIKKDPPHIILIDLVEKPSHARETAKAMQKSKKLSDIPLVFIGGSPEELVKTKSQFPNAIYTTAAETPRLLGKPVS